MGFSNFTGNNNGSNSGNGGGNNSNNSSSNGMPPMMVQMPDPTEIDVSQLLIDYNAKFASTGTVLFRDELIHQTLDRKSVV